MKHKAWLAALAAWLLLATTAGCGSEGAQPGVSTAEQTRNLELSGIEMGISTAASTETAASDGVTSGAVPTRRPAVTGGSTTGGSPQTGSARTTTTATAVTLPPLPGGVTHWFENPLRDIFADTVKSGKSLSNAVIHMARNEAESIQIGLRSAAELTDVTVSVEQPKGNGAPTLTASAIRSVWCSYSSKTVNPASVPDYLRRVAPAAFPEYYESNGYVGTVKANESQGIVVEAASTKATKPGSYTGTVVIRADQGVRRIPVTVTVYDATIPDPKDSKLGYTAWFYGYCDPSFSSDQTGAATYKSMDAFYDFSNRENMWTVLENYAAVMKKQRHNTIAVPTVSLVEYKLDVDAAGRYVIDWSEFDRYVNTFLQHGSVKYLEGWFAGDGEGLPDGNGMRIYEKKNGKVVGRVVSLAEDYDTCVRHMEDFYGQLYAHLLEKGWADIWLQHVADEPLTTQHKEDASKIYKVLKRIMPRIRTFDAGSEQQAHFGEEMDIPVPQLDSYHRNLDIFNKRNANGYYDEVWTYTCINPQGNWMQRVGDYPLLSARVIGWYLYKNNTDGFLHWAWNYWRLSVTGDPTQELACRKCPGDGWLVYPDGPNLSVKEGPRATAVRDGLEDYEILALAAQKNPAKAGELLDETVQTALLFERDETAYMARRLTILKLAAGAA